MKLLGVYVEGDGLYAHVDWYGQAIEHCPMRRADSRFEVLVRGKWVEVPE